MDTLMALEITLIMEISIWSSHRKNLKNKWFLNINIMNSVKYHSPTKQDNKNYNTVRKRNNSNKS